LHPVLDWAERRRLVEAVADRDLAGVGDQRLADGVVDLLEFASRGRSDRLDPVVEADSFEMMREYVLHERVVSLQIPIGLLPARDARVVVREIDPRDLPTGLLLLGLLRGRTLPVASAKFAVQLAATLEAIETASA
jgi:hypothetical protein